MSVFWLICDYRNKKRADILFQATGFQDKFLFCCFVFFYLKWAKPSWATVARSSCRWGEAVQWLRLHYIDGLQLLNLPRSSEVSNVGHWGGGGGGGVFGMKRAREKDELRRFIWPSRAEALSKASPRGQVFTTTDWGAEIEFGGQTKKTSRGRRQTQSSLDDFDGLGHKQDDGKTKRKEANKVKRGVVLQGYNWFSECITIGGFQQTYSAVMRGERAW